MFVNVNVGDDLNVQIGNDAFKEGVGWLGSSIYHEMVHVRQIRFQGPTRVMGQYYSREVKAYTSELMMSRRFGLTNAQKQVLIDTRRDNQTCLDNRGQGGCQ